MEVNKIYLDMDGVLADFDRGVREMCGLEPMDQMKATPSDNDRLWAAVAQVDHYYGRLKMIPGADVMLRVLINEWVCFGGTGILFADVESAVNELHRMEIL